MTAVGNADWLKQVAASSTFLTDIAVNTGGTQSVSLTAFMQPNFLGLLVYWSSNGVPSSGPVRIGLTVGVLNGNTPDVHDVRDNTFDVFSFPGAIATQPGVTVVINIQPSGYGNNPVQGDLLIFGISAPPQVVTQTKRGNIGLGNISGNVLVATGTNVTILAAPDPANYYRIKLLCTGLVTTPAANNPYNWQRLSDAAVIFSRRSTGAGGDNAEVTCDFEWDDGITLNNASGASINAQITYERWPR